MISRIPHLPWLAQMVEPAQRDPKAGDLSILGGK